MAKLDRRAFAMIGVSTLVLGRVPLTLWGDERLGRHRAIRIRPFDPQDAGAVGRLVDLEYLNDADRASSLYAINRGLHLPGGGRSEWRATLVAESDGAVVAVGSARSIALGSNPRAHVIVAAAHRRQGIGTALYREVAALVGARGKTPIASIAAREGIAFQFASACGMRPFMRSRQLTLDLTAWTVDAWCRNAVRQRPVYDLVPSDDLAPDVFFGALGAAYEYMHERWSPVPRLTPTELREAWAPRVSQGSGVVAIERGQAIGAGNFFPNQAVDAGVVVFPTGVCRELASLERERALTAHLLGDRLLAARSAGNRQAILEFDDDDGRLLPLIASIPVASVSEAYMLTAGPTGFWPRPYPHG